MAARIIAGKGRLALSQNEYDWLGEGAYFWENNPQRALEFASESRQRRGRNVRGIKKPAVIGAVIDLGYCLNLLDAKFLQILREGFRTLRQTIEEAGQAMPVNKPIGDGNELLLRNLDCAVINTVHALRSEQGLPAFDTVRSAFIEGGEVFPGSTFREKNHIQICVRNPRCIKGYFWPLDDQESDVGSSAVI